MRGRQHGLDAQAVRHDEFQAVAHGVLLELDALALPAGGHALRVVLGRALGGPIEHGVSIAHVFDVGACRQGGQDGEGQSDANLHDYGTLGQMGIDRGGQL
ncbi:hypothetical protein D3C72_2198400 [compost metagenome]